MKFLLVIPLLFTLACGRPVPSASNEPIAAEAPTDADRMADRIADLRADTELPSPEAGASLPSEVPPSDGRPTLILATTPSKNSRDALLLSRWILSHGAPLRLVWVDLGAPSAAADSFALSVAPGMARLTTATASASLGIARPYDQTPLHFWYDEAGRFVSSRKNEVGLEEWIADFSSALPVARREEAERLRARLRAASARSGDALAREYFALWDSGAISQARALARTALEISAADPVARLLHANFNPRGSTAELAALDKALPAKGLARALHHYVTAKTFFPQKDYNAAAGQIDLAIKAGMGSLEGRTRHVQARYLRFAKRKDDAWNAHVAGFAKGAHTAEYYHHTGELCDLFRTDSGPDYALQAYRIAMILEPWDGTLSWHVGNTIHRMGRHEDAVVAWRESIDLDPSNARSAYEAGRCLLFHLKNPAAAAELLRESIRRGGEKNSRVGASCWNDFGAATMALGDTALGIAACLEAVRLEENHPYAYVNLGRGFESIGRMGTAQWAYESAVRLAPQATATSEARKALKRLRGETDDGPSVAVEDEGIPIRSADAAESDD